MAISLPYVQAHSNISKVLEKIKNASLPPRFTQDYLATKLGIKSSAAKPVIPFLKRIGFLGSDGVPTDLYKAFRNSVESGRAAAEGLRIGYREIFEINEYANDLSDAELKGIVVQITGLEPDARNTQAIVGSFKALKEFADFNADPPAEKIVQVESIAQLESELAPTNSRRSSDTLSLSYTINLNFPATSDIAVFDAIFKSLKDHLLK
ncbi:MAG: hypothetical protein DBY20_01455 [Coriobacteriia bacterium]|nr:MAG: hypothetical protein DBY20_01455 [Coriobacteriia bacterium]